MPTGRNADGYFGLFADSGDMPTGRYATVIKQRMEQLQIMS